MVSIDSREPLRRSAPSRLKRTAKYAALTATAAIGLGMTIHGIYREKDANADLQSAPGQAMTVLQEQGYTIKTAPQPLLTQYESTLASRQDELMNERGNGGLEELAGLGILTMEGMVIAGVYLGSRDTTLFDAKENAGAGVAPEVNGRPTTPPRKATIFDFPTQGS